MFIDRSDELAMLDLLLNRQRGGELLPLYGRRRVGKTALHGQSAGQGPSRPLSPVRRDISATTMPPAQLRRQPAADVRHA